MPVDGRHRSMLFVTFTVKADPCFTFQERTGFPRCSHTSQSPFVDCLTDRGRIGNRLAVLYLDDAR